MGERLGEHGRSRAVRETKRERGTENQFAKDGKESQERARGGTPVVEREGFGGETEI